MRIIGTGSALPKKIVTNDELSKIVETSDEWITDRTGIRLLWMRQLFQWRQKLEKRH